MQNFVRLLSNTAPYDYIVSFKKIDSEFCIVKRNRDMIIITWKKNFLIKLKIKLEVYIDKQYIM